MSLDGGEGVGVERLRQARRRDAGRLGGRQQRDEQPRLGVDGGAEAQGADPRESAERVVSGGGGGAGRPRRGGPAGRGGGGGGAGGAQRGGPGRRAAASRRPRLRL